VKINRQAQRNAIDGGLGELGEFSLVYEREDTLEVTLCALEVAIHARLDDGGLHYHERA